MCLFELNNVSFSYPNHQPIIAGANLSLVKGERLCINGHNGAGKSTLLRLMIGLLKPTAGSIKAFGQTCQAEADFNQVRQRVGLVFQDADDQLFCPTVVDDIAFGPLNQGKHPEEAFAMVTKVLQDMHLEYLQERITHKLSGGEKRLVALASVLVMQPDILLLDEPTNALDEANKSRLVDILLNLPQTMVIVSHDPHFRLKLSTRNLRLAEGALQEASKIKPRCKHARD